MITTMRGSVSAYAGQHGVNPDTGTGYRLAGFEYLRDIMDDQHSRLVIQKAAQVGATVMAILRTIWFLDTYQRSAMYLFPTHRTADRFRRGRFNVMVQHSPHFREHIQATGAPGHLRWGVAHFYCHGARSRAELMSVPLAYLTLDERDELYRVAGLEDTPWSAVDLARQRLGGQEQSWELSLSTPTIPSHGIALEFSQSDQRHYVVTCPRCVKLTRLDWPGVIVGIDGPPHQARFGCPLCKERWSAKQRLQAIGQGQWIPHTAGNGTHGYYLSHVLSPVAKAPKMVKQWQDAQGDPAALQVFHNSVLGLPYLADGSRLETSFIEEAISRSDGTLMAGSSSQSVAGIDVGPQLLHVVIAERSGTLCRIVWAGVVTGWQELEQLFARYTVRSFVIDAQPETHQARKLVQRYPFGWLCYYRSGPGAQPHSSTSMNILRVPRSETLDALYQAWRMGHMALPRDVPSDFIAQLRSPVRVVRLDRRGQARVDYLEASGPDHYAHAMNYCLLALGLGNRQEYFAVTRPE